MGWDPAVVPDPQDPATYERSKLDWDELAEGRHARMLEVYRRLAALRRSRPELTDPSFASVSCTADEKTRLFRMRRGDLEVVVNFGDDAAEVDLDGPTELLFATGDGVSVDRARLALPGHAGALVAPAAG